MTKKNLFEKKLLTVSLGLAAVMLSFGLALALTNCGGDDDDAPAVVYYGDTTVASGESGVLTSTFVDFNGTASADWFPGLKALGGSVSSTGSGKTITLTFITTSLTVPSVTKKLVIPKAAFSPALAEDLDTGIEITFISGKTGFTAKKAGELALDIENATLSLSLVEPQDGKITISIPSVNLTSEGVSVSEVSAKFYAGNYSATPFKTISGEIIPANASGAKLKLDPQQILSGSTHNENGFYSTKTVVDGSENAISLGWIEVTFTVKDAAGGTADGKLRISPEVNSTVYSSLSSDSGSLFNVYAEKSTLNSLKTPTTTPYARIYVTGSGSYTVYDNNYNSLTQAGVKIVSPTVADNTGGKAGTLTLSGNSGEFKVCVGDWFPTGNTGDGTVKFEDVQLQTSNFYYNYGSVSIYVDES